MNRTKSAFTLIELLVVISIISLLIAILLPALGKARESSRRIACATKVRSLTQASIVYSLDYNGSLPTTYGARAVNNGYFALARSAKQLVTDYLSATHSNYQCLPMKCPSNGYGINGAGQPSHDYTYNGNIAYWPGVGTEQWINITHDMVMRAADKYGARWGLFFDRVIPNDNGTHTGLTSTNHLEGVTIEGGNVAWADGSTSWVNYESGNGWVSMDPGGVRGPKSGINLMINHPGGGQLQFVGATTTSIYTGVGTDSGVKSQALSLFQ